MSQKGESAGGGEEVFSHVSLPPVRCTSCGNVLADKIMYYLKETRRRKLEKGEGIGHIYIKPTDAERSVNGKVLDEMGLTLPCCRKELLTMIHGT